MSKYLTLERKPGGPDNWVERVGGLPKYINLIAQHLHYVEGFTISHAIATAVNTVKRWARKGTVVKYNDPKNNHVYTITAARAAADVAEWEAKKARAKGMKLAVPSKELTVAKRKKRAAGGQALPDGSFPIFDETSLRSAIRLAGRSKNHSKAEVMRHIRKRAAALGLTRVLEGTGASGGSRGRLASRSVRLSEASVNLAALAERANAIVDPSERGVARAQILDLAGEEAGVVDLALTKDGRKSYKNKGKWKHGFVPVDEDAKTSKAKGSPIAKRRMNRLYGNPAKAEAASKAAIKRTLAQRASKGQSPAPTGGFKLRSSTGKKGGKQQERVQRVALARNADVRGVGHSQRAKPKVRPEIGKGQRSPARATQPWGKIPDDQKVVRNGKRYVMTVFRGRQLLTEWTGAYPKVEAPGKGDIQYSRVTSATLQNMTTGQLRKLLRSGKQPPAVRSKIRKMLDSKQAKNRRRA